MKCRYRYRNHSPKRRSFDGLHEWAKLDNGVSEYKVRAIRSRKTKPARFQQFPVGLYIRWQFSEGAMVLLGRDDRMDTPKMASWVHGAAMEAKRRLKHELGAAAYRKTPKQRGSARVP